MKSRITHIGIKQNREKGFRYKRLLHSGIFDGEDTRQKSIDCQGPFEDWTSSAAKNWIFARVKEQKEGKNVHIVCDCCDTRDFDLAKITGENNTNFLGRVNLNCCGGELLKLIIRLSEEQ